MPATPVAHGAAAYGHLGQLPAGFLTPEVLALKTHMGNTLLHEAAEHGALDRLPPGAPTAERLREKNISGETVFHVVPRSTATSARSRRNWSPPRRSWKRTNAGDTAIHAAAIAGHLGQIPAQFLNHATLIAASNTGFTPIHAAAETGQLNQLPRAVLTADLLLLRNDNGDTPLHAAAYEAIWTRCRRNCLLRPWWKPATMTAPTSPRSPSIADLRINCPSASGPSRRAPSSACLPSWVPPARRSDF